MPLIQPYMAVKCRNREEIEVFMQVAEAEGHKRLSCEHYDHAVFVTNYTGGFIFPNDIGMTSDINYIDVNPNDTKIFVEAADLFRNHLISRRIKREWS